MNAPTELGPLAGLEHLAYSQAEPVTEVLPRRSWPSTLWRAAAGVLVAGGVSWGVVDVWNAYERGPAPPVFTVPSGEPAPAPPPVVMPTDTPAIPPDVPHKIGADALFVVLLQQNKTLTVDGPVAALGREQCAYLAAGHTTDEAVTALMSKYGYFQETGERITAADARLIVVSAERAYCPQYAD